MNRAVQKLHRRRCALKNNLAGGGLLVNPEVTIVSNNGVPYPENQQYSECYDPVRPGALATQANPELAQVAMAGGRLTRRLAGGSAATRKHRHRGGYNVMSASHLASMMKKGGKRQGCGLMRGGSNCMLRSRRMRGGSNCMLRSRRMRGGSNCMLRSRRMRGGACGCGMRLRGGQCQMRGGQCGQPQLAWLGGRTRKMRGGLRGFEMNVADNVGGMGPIAEPARTPIPCDARAGMQNPFTATPFLPDSRATFGYSLTPNMTTPSVQAGGQLSERIPNFEYSQTGAGYGGNAYDASCYKAPGSEMPVYPATSAGFHFTPSTEGGATLPDGITAFNEVVAHTARLGGARKSRKNRSYRKKAKKAHRSRRN